MERRSQEIFRYVNELNLWEIRTIIKKYDYFLNGLSTLVKIPRARNNKKIYMYKKGSYYITVIWLLL